MAKLLPKWPQHRLLLELSSSSNRLPYLAFCTDSSTTSRFWALLPTGWLLWWSEFSKKSHPKSKSFHSTTQQWWQQKVLAVRFFIRKFSWIASTWISLERRLTKNRSSTLANYLTRSRRQPQKSTFALESYKVTSLMHFLNTKLKIKTLKY